MCVIFILWLGEIVALLQDILTLPRNQ